MREIFTQNIISPCETKWNFVTSNPGSKDSPVFRVKVNIRGYDTPSAKDQAQFLSKLKNTFTADIDPLFLIGRVNELLRNELLVQYSKLIEITVTCPDSEDECKKFIQLREKTGNETSSYNYIYCTHPPNPNKPDYMVEVHIQMNPEHHSDFLRIEEVLPSTVIFSNSFHKHKKLSATKSYFWQIEFVILCKQEEDFFPIMFLSPKIYKVKKVRKCE